MTKLEKILFLNKMLLIDMPQYEKQAKKFKANEEEQQQLFRSLMNLRPPSPLREDFLRIQDEILREETQQKGRILLSDLQPIQDKKQLYLWKGDITRLQVDAIVNAANSALLGCFIPCHACIDNAIHSAAGLQLRQACHEIMEKQGHEEATGLAKITKAYNLPSQYIIHTVGPIITGRLRQTDCNLLESCYRNCLKLAISKNLKSIAFCCISTGEFHFPNDVAAKIAVNTVQELLKETQTKIEVIFNVFKEQDYKLYRQLLGEDYKDQESHPTK